MVVTVTDDMASIVLEAVTEQVDAGDLVSGESIKDQLDADEVGGAVGARIGESIGRTVGRTIGREVSDAITEWLRGDPNGNDGVVNALKSAVWTGVREGISEVGEQDSTLTSLASAFTDADLDEGPLGLDDDEDEDEAAAEAPAEAESTTESTASVAEDTAENDTDGDDAAEGEPTDADDVADSVDPAEVDETELSELRTETLESYLEMLSYRDLQSIAKEVDVTANLKREEMTARIVETVADSAST